MVKPKAPARRGSTFTASASKVRSGPGVYGDDGHRNPGTDSLSVNSSSDLIADELSDDLIEFVSQSSVSSEPPRKRRKLATDEKIATESLGVENGPEDALENGDLEHILVKKAAWEIKCQGSKLSQFKTPLSMDNICLNISVQSRDGAGYLEILDGNKKRRLFIVPFPPEDALSEDIRHALAVNDLSSHLWSKGQGKMWTSFGLALYQKEGSDYLQVDVNINWNITRSPYHIPQFSKKPLAISQVLKYYFPDENTGTDNTWSPQDFYRSVHVPNKADKSLESLKLDELQSDLYPFQKRAVQWLLRREGVKWSQSDGKIQSLENTYSDDLPHSFMKTTDAEGQLCYVSSLYGIATRDITPFLESERLLKGGILAEEMGLGKTVEIVSLICLHKRPQEGQAKVFDPYIGEQVRPTSATLIITPPSILQQWISELGKHAPYLRVMHYQGIKAHSNLSSSKLLENLANSDVVVSTYAVLAAELNFTKLNPEKELRRESKYPRPKSPLMQLSWWRVAIDEAQMIESGVSNAAIVARIIPRINAWTITGTPVRKDVSDLRGLLIFLRKEPYASIKHVWSSLISTHKHDFRSLFGGLALRHSKQSVREELRLPAQRRYVSL